MRLAIVVLALAAWTDPSPPQQEDAATAVSSAVARAGKAHAEGRRGDLAKEVALAARIAGDRVPLRRTMAANLVDVGLPELAAQVCEQTIPMAPEDGGLRGIHGVALLRSKRIVEAIAALEIATKKEPARKEWWLNLGRAYLQADQEAAALAAIQHAAEIAADDLAVLELEAECEYRNMRLEKCIATCQKLLARDPKSAMGWQLLIRTRRTQLKLDDALLSADEALKAVGRQGALVLERGLVLLAANRNEEAARDLKEAADLLPGDARPYLHLCKAYTRLGLVKEAAAAKARYLELSPDAKPASRKSG